MKLLIKKCVFLIILLLSFGQVIGQDSNTKLTKIKVCVVGAGASGLAAARHLTADANRSFDFVVFERQSDVGGTWIYTDKIGLDEDGLPVHSSMYRDLRTNAARELMGFPDYPEIKGGNRSCVKHEVILEYLKNYTEHFQLRSHIRFNTLVESIRLKNAGIEEWEVVVRNVKSQKKETLNCDAVMICNGHNSDPYVPQIPGLEDFQGQKLHSHDYRKPEDFAGKKVILLGAAGSGRDIASELSKTARVYLSHNKARLGADKTSLGFIQVAGIDRFSNRTFILKDGSSVDADVLIFCTGYNVTYPFLNETCGIEVDDNFVFPLYKHIVNVNHPSMGLIGLPMAIFPFPTFHLQAQYFLSMLRDRWRLPGTSVMLEDARLKVPKKRSAHRLDDKSRPVYCDSLAREGGFEPLPPRYEIGNRVWRDLRDTRPGDFKSFNLIIASDSKSAWVKGPLDGSH